MPAPAQARKIGGDETNFKSVGVTLAKSLVTFAGLKPDSRVLEIGCGFGRVALPLSLMLDERGTYAGTDVMRDGIDWCRANITRQGFSFHHFDIYNEFYNPRGLGSVEDTPLPFEDGAFDLVFLTSVFTHLVQEDVAAYMREIRRVLAPNGTLAGTWFQVEADVSTAILDGRTDIPLRWADGRGGYFSDANRGTLAVGYDETEVDRFHAEAGLAITQKRLGNWQPRANGGPNVQDWIYAKPV